jgi:soluble P-type ATPase
MIELNIPGKGIFQIDCIVCDVNGTLAVDGKLLPGVVGAIQRLSDRVKIYTLTANTHGRQEKIDLELGFAAVIIQKGQEIDQKRSFVENLDANRVIAIGQGANDAGMLEAAAIGICVLSTEGAAVETWLKADIVVPDIQTAFSLIENPLRLVATLRK